MKREMFCDRRHAWALHHHPHHHAIPTSPTGVENIPYSHHDNVLSSSNGDSYNLKSP